MADKIIGGVESVQGRFPYAASLQIDGVFPFCGGSLIGPNLVLTASHCLFDFDFDVYYDLEDFSVVVGCTDLLDPTNCERFGVLDFFLHPNYDPEVDERFDVALVQLDGSTTITPVVLASSRPNDGDVGTVIGWGTFDPYGYGYGHDFPSENLREVDLTVISNVACQGANDDLFDLFDLPSIFRFTIFDEMVCAIGDFQDSCQGDSGGPLVLACDGVEQDVQFGVVSFGIGCAVEGVPGVYANVAEPGILSFIESKASELGVIVNTTSDVSSFCSTGIENIVPTPFPVKNDGWICDINNFFARDGCNCNCGIADPDCQYQQLINDCNGNEVCINGLCSNDTLPNAPAADPRTFAPVPDPTNAPVPDPTNSPVPDPTNSPVPDPTNSPVPDPTNSPVPDPTNSPVQSPVINPVADTPAPVANPPSGDGGLFGSENDELVFGIAGVLLFIAVLLVAVIFILKNRAKATPPTAIESKPVSI